MYCKNCGAQMNDNAAVCVNCGAPKGAGTSYCPNCGSQTQPNAAICLNCGVALNGPAPVPVGVEQKSRMTAGLLGIFLGGLGIHNFYLGYTTKAVIQLILTLVSCGIASIWGSIEGILILCGKIKVDGKGIPLKD